jgi:hypothetical protein
LCSICSLCFVFHLFPVFCNFSSLAVSLHLPGAWISYLLQRLVYGMDDSSWFEFRQGTSYFSLRLLLDGCRRSCPGLKRPALKVRHSPPLNVEFMNEWRCTSTTAL